MLGPRGLSPACTDATILSAAMMCRYSLNLPAAADRIEQAVDQVLALGQRTPDIYSNSPDTQLVGTDAMTGAVLDALSQQE